jgi:hypothetical protein
MDLRPWTSGIGDWDDESMGAGRWLIVIGLGLVILGLLDVLGSKFGFPRLGRLPGDIIYRGEHSVFYFPITTCIVVSILLKLLSWLFQRLL